MLGSCAAAVCSIALSARQSSAYATYSGGADGSCMGCHGSFDADQEEWGGVSLHKVHRDPAFMGTACPLCHQSSNYRTTLLKLSAGTVYNMGLGCSGCHPSSGLIGPHGGSGSSCALGPTDCHGSGWASSGFPENQRSWMFPYFGTPDTKLGDPCDLGSPGGEDWNGDGKGLDNDGDGLYDAADPDCCDKTVEVCPRCGNGVHEPAEEFCDDSAAVLCPVNVAECDDGNPYTLDSLLGSAAICTARCRNVYSDCVSGDGGCPGWCTFETDTDCYELTITTCADIATLYPGETCGKPRFVLPPCPTDCDDGDACTTDIGGGLAELCNIRCSHYPIVACQDGDGCCPWACNTTTDSDCEPRCGNGVVEVGETCDPPSACPDHCDAGGTCTLPSLNGAASTCNVSCDSIPVTACAAADGCCPSGCSPIDDNDCPGVCGDDLIETGETCDPPSTCPLFCEDDDPCTEDRMVGTYSTCNAYCEFAPVACGPDTTETDGGGVAKSLGISCTSCAEAKSGAGVAAALVALARRRRTRFTS
ncbi:MAG: hypothetical protein HY903_19555 [Deltaproteobacteria bacterium]|nr:hypothetical protein [Deltaproteobacteria bacterium]